MFTDNKNRKLNEASKYYSARFNIDGKNVDLLFTQDELKRPMQRAALQPEDVKRSTATLSNIIEGVWLALALASIVLILLSLMGCSHNISTYSDGIGLETTFRPDSGNFGVIMRYGKIWNLVARENTEAEMSGATETSADTGLITKTDGTVHIKIGPQTTGYEADIAEDLKDNPEALTAFYNYKQQVQSWENAEKAVDVKSND